MKKVLLRRVCAVLTALCVTVPALLAAGCSAEDKNTGAIVLTDSTGAQVTLDHPAERIVSGYYVTTYALLALGQGEKLVGIEKKAETRPLYGMAQPELLSLPAVGTMKECNVEAIASLEPDLVLLPQKLAEYAETLRELGIPTVTVSPESQEELRGMLTLLGAACGAEDRAAALLAYYDEKAAFLDEIAGTDGDAEKPSVVFCGNSSYLTAAPEGMYQSSLISLAGGVNAAADLAGDYWTEISYETLLAWDPDAVILPCGAQYTAEDLAADGPLSALTAVKNSRVLAMPSGIEEWDSPVPSGILGALWLASVLHPEAYDASAFTADVTEYYETFYGFTPETALWN